MVSLRLLLVILLASSLVETQFYGMGMMPPPMMGMLPPPPMMGMLPPPPMMMGMPPPMMYGYGFNPIQGALRGAAVGGMLGAMTGGKR
ncbi:unnamed protein product [Nippostrongylus brasiliensis]|uniref:Uncharacterized protein n=1 Tax=Nippostrongylus brasiliensis TaxID=27835 RepID=A0A0N4YI84_NIPBR|nr:hypothetical protein Q1695_003165 [Nippostrongylus brasiliensis]VDL80207.1 unnamed protein product [Nippostrongylus brasiliensis]